MIDEVSLNNYYSLLEELSKREVLVFKALIKLVEATSWQIEDHLFKEGLIINPYNPNYVRPRLTDLKNKNLIFKSHQITINNITQWVWKVKEEYSTIQKNY